MKLMIQVPDQIGWYVSKKESRKLEMCIFWLDFGIESVTKIWLQHLELDVTDSTKQIKL